MVKNQPANGGDIRHAGSIPVSRRSPGGGHSNPPVFLPGESHGQRSLAGYSPWGCKESDMTEVTLHSQITLSISAMLFSICWQCFQSKFQQDGKMTIEV